jgi:hypothetical protein
MTVWIAEIFFIISQFTNEDNGAANCALPELFISKSRPRQMTFI